MFTTIDALPRTGQTRALMRALALLFVAAVVFVTVYPLSGWSRPVDGPLAFLVRGLPRWWTWFDVLANGLAYTLLGLLLSLGWMTRLGLARTIAVTALFGTALSLGLETVQSFLPVRVASLLDWLANSVGALVGGVMGGLLNRAARDAWQRPLPGSQRWYEQGAPSGWVLLLLWLATALVPQRLLFATGDVRGALQQLLHGLYGAEAPDLGHQIDRLWDGPTPAAVGVTIEAAVVVCAACVIGSLAFALVRSAQQRLVLLLGIAVFAFGLRSMATQLVHGSGEPLAWLTPGAQGGLVVGAALLYALETLGPRSRALIAVVLAGVGFVLVNLAPEDSYFEQALAGVRSSQLVNLQGLLRAVSMLWPIAAIVWFMRRLRRRRERWL